MKPISENDMIATFLKAEINSRRFGIFILELLKRDHKNRKIIDNPDLDNVAENEYRKKLLTEYRGYGSKTLLFEGFPDSFNWFRMSVTKDDLNNFKYIDYSYWIELSGKTRVVKDAVKNIQSGLEVYGESNDHFFSAANAVDEGTRFAEIILVAKDKSDIPVILEGHLRATAYAMAKKPLESIDVLIGYALDIQDWSCY